MFIRDLHTRFRFIIVWSLCLFVFSCNDIDPVDDDSTTPDGVDTSAPTVVGTEPADTQTGVALNANINVTFSEDCDAATITADSFTLTGGGATVSGAVSVSGSTATFNPDSDLSSNTTYTATVTSAVTDGAGNPLASDYTWRFTTTDSLAHQTYNIGINTNGTIDWNYDKPFADIMRTWRLWQCEELDANGNSLERTPPLDENGWPLTDFITIIYHGNIPYNHGTYKMQFTGSADVSTPNGRIENINHDATTNITTLDLVISDPDNDMLSMTFRNTNGGIKDAKLMRPLTGGSTTSYPFETVFTDHYLELLEPYSTIRYMGWTNTNGSKDTVWSNTVPWSYSTLSVENFYASWESVIKLSNAAAKDAWICVPHMVDDDYIRQLATLFRDGSDSVEPLDSKLKLYIEYSNEIWNWGGYFPQTAWVRDQAIAYGHPLDFDGETDEVSLMYRYKAMRSVQISRIFREIFGNDQMMTRIRPVICWQKGWNDMVDRTLSFVDRYYNHSDSRSDWVDPHPINYYFYGGGSSGYWAHGEDVTPTTENIWDAGEWNHQTFADNLFADAAWTRAHGLTILAYEGDNHPYFNGDEAIYRQIHWDERMYQETIDHLNAFSWVGGDLFCFLVLNNFGPETIWGAYHIYDGLDASPQYRAVLDVVDSTPPPPSFGDVVPFSTPGSAYDVFNLYEPNPDGVGSLTLTSNSTHYSSAYMFRTTEDRACDVQIEYTTSEPATLIIEYDGDEMGRYNLTDTGEGIETTTAITIHCPSGILHSIRLVCTTGAVNIEQVIVN